MMSPPTEPGRQTLKKQPMHAEAKGVEGRQGQILRPHQQIPADEGDRKADPVKDEAGEEVLPVDARAPGEDVFIPDILQPAAAACPPVGTDHIGQDATREEIFAEVDR